MALEIETFSSLKGGNSFFKAITHPEVRNDAASLVRRLRAASPVAVYDPLGFAAGFWACWAPDGLSIAEVYVQNLAELGETRLGHAVRPVTDLATSDAGLLFVVAFDAARALGQIRHFVPPACEIVTLDVMRLPDAFLSRPASYLDPLNFATNFAFFRDNGDQRTRLVTANYWRLYEPGSGRLRLTLFDAAGDILASWHEEMGPAQSSIVIDSRDVRQRFALPPFEGQLFIHAVGAAGHDVVKYALDTIEESGTSLSCTHDANAWPADYYAGLPAPRDDERVVLWIQNSLPIPIPAGALSLNEMGHAKSVTIPGTVAPFATLPVDVAALLPDLRWPQQIELTAGRHFVRPRYEVLRGGRRRIAHVNVERTDLQPVPALAGLTNLLGKGFILPAPLLPAPRWKSVVLPTPMARSQTVLPIAATLYDPGGQPIAEHRFGRLARDQSVALDLDELLGRNPPPFGHVELTYDWSAGDEADGWLHALFRYEDRATGHVAESSFGAHIFNTVMTWRDEPQSYSGKPPGLSTRLFLRLGEDGFDTICHLIYPASTPWLPQSSTDLILIDRDGGEAARRRVEIACGGSLFWRASEIFSPAERLDAAGGSVTVRDETCRLFGYHGLDGGDGRFSLDHMFGF